MTKMSRTVVIQFFDTSRYTSASDKTEEEIMFWEGTADGPAKLTYLEDGRFKLFLVVLCKLKICVALN